MPSDPIPRLNAALEGRYRIERQLGEGGMATVYLADDLRHERKVALKVLKPELAAVVGADRFLAEIKTTANLQHPHILPLFDSGEADSFLFYVMPYVEGESLRERLDREHQLPVDEAVAIAKNVAEALDYAHSHGVIHRDIKPANILLQAGKPVVSDFGIALALGAAGAGRLTETGLSVGTPHYMSPEQAMGDVNVGAASDIYALACVLYELLAGDPPYTASTPQAILGQIVTSEPDSVTKHRKSVPPNVASAIGKALEKIPADRFADAQDFARALGDLAFRHGEATGSVATRGRAWKPLSVAGVGLALILVLTVAQLLLRPNPPAPPSRQVMSPAGWAGPVPLFGRRTAIAPDGSSMVLPRGVWNSDRPLLLKRRNSIELTPIPETQGARDLAYSPDGEWIVYALGTGELFKQQIAGGSRVRLATDADFAGNMSLDWLDDGTILYEAFDPAPGAQRQRELVRISANGGESSSVSPLPARVANPVWVRGLPDARGALVVGCPGISFCGTQSSLHVVDLNDGSWKPLLDRVLRAWYVPTGQLVYVQSDGAVFGASFDLGSLAITGDPVPLFEGVRTNNLNGRLSVDMQLAGDGTLLYVQGSTFQGGNTLVFVDRAGRGEPVQGMDPGSYTFPRFSPDGGRLVYGFVSDSTADLWVLDLARGSKSRITFDIPDPRWVPVWSPDGSRIAFPSDIAGTNELLVAAADPSRQVDTLPAGVGLKFPTSWSPDGKVLAYYQADSVTLRDIWLLPDGGEPVPFLVTPSEERAPTFSPDGRWIAYVSDQSGQDEVYVQPYPGPGPTVTISTGGGSEPVWSPDGSELFYRTPEAQVVVATEPGDTFRAGRPQVLFTDEYVRNPAATAASAAVANYDISPDGERFVMIQSDVTSAVSAASGEEAAVVLVYNWLGELRELMEN